MASFYSIIDRLKEGTNNAADMAGKLTKNAVSKVEGKAKEVKLRYSIREVEDRIQSAFAAIGASVYESYKADTEEKDFSELFGKLDALNDELELLKNELMAESNQCVCPSCQKTVNKNAVFCPGCGAKLKDE